MHEQDGEYHDEFARLSEFAQRASASHRPEQIRARGVRRKAWRNAGRVALGTTALMAVAGLSVNLTGSHAGHRVNGTVLSSAAAPGAPIAAGGVGPSATSSAVAPSAVAPVSGAPRALSGTNVAGVSAVAPSSVGAPVPRATLMVLSRNGTDFDATFAGANGSPDIFGLGATATQVQYALQQLGVTQISIVSVSSDTVPADDVIDIDHENRSVLNHSIDVSTPLVLIASSGPTR